MKLLSFMVLGAIVGPVNLENAKGNLIGIRALDQAQWPPAHSKPITAQTLMRAKFTSKAKFNQEISRDSRPDYFKLDLI